MEIFELQKKIYGKWKHLAFYSSYGAAQKAFIYQDGGFRIVKHALLGETLAEK